MNIDLSHLEALNQAVRRGTFEGAASALNVTPSAISQRIKALETAVGRVLLQRTKPVIPTESGEVLLLATRQIEMILQDTEAQLGIETNEESIPQIPIAINADSLATWAMNALEQFAGRAVFDIHCEDERHTLQLLRQGYVVAAITAERTPVPGCTSTRLGVMHYRPMATKSFANRWFADGFNAETISRAPVIVFDREDELQDRFARRFSRKPYTAPRSYVPSSSDYGRAIESGLGWGLVPHLQSPTSTKKDPVIPLADQFIDVALYLQQWRLSSRLLTDVATAITDVATDQLK